MSERHDYFRRDRSAGITPPDLSRQCTYAEHVVRARGKKSRYTSVSLSPDKIHDFGEVLYKLKRPKVDDAGHSVVEHDALMDNLRQQATDGVKEDRLRAIQALRYARRRKEGLVEWNLDLSKVSATARLKWAAAQIAPFFSKG